MNPHEADQANYTSNENHRSRPGFSLLVLMILLLLGCIIFDLSDHAI